MSKTLKLSEAILNPPKSFSVRIPPSAANTCLAKYLHALVRFPKFLLESSQLVLAKEEKEILDDLFERQMGVTGWLSHLIFNRGRKTPDELKNTYLRVYEPDALLSEALLKLTEGVCDRSEKLDYLKPPELDDCDLPSYVWFSCEMGFLYAEIENSGIGMALGLPAFDKNPAPVGKTDAVAIYRQELDILEGIKPLEQTPTNDPDTKLPAYLISYYALLDEAWQIAQNDDDFEAEFWTPYIKMKRRWVNVVRKDKTRQAKTLSPNGEIYETGRNQKRPKGFARM